MIVLALDIGEVRTGIAVSDSSGKIAMPLVVLPTSELMAGSRKFQAIIDDHGPHKLLIGLPKTLAGDENQQTQRTRAVAQKLATKYDMELDFVDERLSSVQAKRALREQGCTEKQMRGKIDKVAAAIFLQSYLDEGGAALSAQ